MSEPVDLQQLRVYADCLAKAKPNCDCQVGGVDAISIDADWLALVGRKFIDLLGNVYEEIDRIIELEECRQVLSDDVVRLERENAILRDQRNVATRMVEVRATPRIKGLGYSDE